MRLVNPDHRFDITVGLWLEALRLSRGWSVRELGEFGGLSETTVRRAEDDDPTVTAFSIMHLAHVLGADWDDVPDEVRAATGRRQKRAGRQRRRDREFPPFRNRKFRRWWHRVGKKDYGGDIESASAAQQIYDEWRAAGYPEVKLIVGHAQHVKIILAAPDA